LKGRGKFWDLSRFNVPSQRHNRERLFTLVKKKIEKRNRRCFLGDIKEADGRAARARQGTTGRLSPFVQAGIKGKRRKRMGGGIIPKRLSRRREEGGNPIPRIEGSIKRQRGGVKIL